MRKKAAAAKQEPNADPTIRIGTPSAVPINTAADTANTVATTKTNATATGLLDAFAVFMARVAPATDANATQR